MAILKHVRRLIYIDNLIRRKATGNLDSFAAKNGLCRRAMTDVLNEMKELGFPIKFDRVRNSYYYHEKGEMVKNLFVYRQDLMAEQQIANIDSEDDLCFSATTIYKLCK